MKDSVELCITRINGERVYPPSRTCLVCGCLETPKAPTVNMERAWLCKKCKSALLKVVEKESGGTE